MAFLLLLALTTALSKEKWVPADTDAADQTCGMDAHRHSLVLDEKGKYVVEKEKGEPDIMFDGGCHDNTTEKRTDEPRRALPVPELKRRNENQE